MTIGDDESRERTEKSVARSSLIMAAGTFTSRALGMVRSPILLTMVIGLNNPIANAFDIANTLPNILFGVIASGLINAVLVPAIVSASQQGSDGGAAYINKIITLAVLALGGITLVLTLAAPLVVKAFAATMARDWYEITVYFAYWCIPQLFFYGLYAVLGQILNARENFGPYMWVPVANNVVAIGGLLLLLSLFGTPTVEQTHLVTVWQGARGTILAAFATGGIVVQALLLFIPLRRLGIRFRPDFHWRGVGLKATGKASLWALATTLTGMIPLTLVTNVAAGATQRALSAGADTTLVAGNAAHSVAYTLVYLPISLFALSIVTAVYTKMAEAGARRDFAFLRSQAVSTANVVAVFNFLCIALFIVFARPLARIFVPTGTDAEVYSLAVVIMCFCAATIGKGIGLVYSRVCYSLAATRTVFLAGLVPLAFEIVAYPLCGFLPPRFTVPAIALAASIDSLIFAVVLIMMVRRMLGSVGARRLISSHLRLVVATAVTCAIGVGALWLIGYARVAANVGIAVVTVVLGGIAVSAVFVAMLKLVRLPEWGQVASRVGSLLQRFKRR